jgi:hypothetical protein
VSNETKVDQDNLQLTTAISTLSLLQKLDIFTEAARNKAKKKCRLQQSRSATPNIQTPTSASHQPYNPIYPPLTLRNTKRHLAYHNAPPNDVGSQLIRNPKLKTARALNARGFMLFCLVANHAMRLRQECNASIFIAVCRFICAPVGEF